MAGQRPPDNILGRLRQELDAQINPAHGYRNWLGHGATGIVVAVDELSLGHGRALKILRPNIENIHSANLHRTFADYFASEIEQMASVTHQNVVRVYSKGSLTGFHDPLSMFDRTETYSSPFYIMEVVDGKDLDEYIEHNISSLTGRELKDIIIQIVEGVNGIHSAKVLHGDLKPGNIVVTEQQTVKVTDFGFAKTLLRPQSDSSFWCQDPSWLHPELKWLRTKQALEQPTGTRSIIQVANSLLTTRGRIWELHSLGKTLEWVLDTIYQFDHEHRDHRISRSDYEFLRLTISRLIDPRTNADDWDIPPRGDMYRSSEELLADIRKLTRPHALGGDAPEFSFQLRRVLQPPLSTPMAFTKRLQQLVDHPLFQRLGDVSQLGVVNLAFRAARHSRFEHSTGVLCLAVDYLRALWTNSNSSYFRQAASEQDCILFLVAALLHDLGQYPFAHAFEESENQRLVFSHELLTERLIAARETRDIVDRSQLSLFENIEDFYWDSLHSLMRDSKGRYIADIIEQEWELNPDDVVAILSGNVANLSYRSSVADILHDAIDGPIDVDKLDYIQRDSYHLGLPGRLNIHAVVGDLSITEREGRMRLTISEDGITAAQDLHMARYRLFTDVYWNRVSRSAERMLRYAVDTLRSLLGDASFSKMFFLQVLTNSDFRLIEILKQKAVQHAVSDSSERMRGCVDILDRVQKRNLYLEAIVIDASRDEAVHRTLCELWVAALKSAEGASDFALLTRYIRDYLSTAINEEMPEHMVLLDIPHSATDQPKKYDAYVHTREGDARRIGELSPMWNTFSEMFRLHGRKVRLFVAAEFLPKIPEKLCRLAIQAALDKIRDAKKRTHR